MKILTSCSIFLLAVFLMACSEKKEQVSEKPLSLLEMPAKPLELNKEINNKLQTIKSEKVQLRGFTGKEFFVKSRTPHITQYKCSECHQGKLAPLPEGQKRSQLMHVDIPLQHAASHVMNCRSCHNTDDMDTLKLNDGSKVGFNHAYKLCTQCHFEQGKDWVGGAHGKRLHAWRGKRVIMNCTECHDPHKPSFDQRAPVGRPSIPRTKLLKE